MKNILKYAMVIACLAMVAPAVIKAQDIAKNERKSEKHASVAHLIESKRYVFEARMVSPSGGQTRQLNGNYDFTVNGDSIISFLPYFGRAYVAPMTNNDAGIRFTSTEFKYEVKPRKKGGWNIQLAPADVDNIRQINLSISEAGQASLHVTSDNRQPISFVGTIRERRTP